MSNYGWVPRPSEWQDDYLEALALLVERRPGMEMIQIVSTVQAFVEEANLRAAPPPIDDELVVGGHAHREGHWAVEPFPGAGDTTFETLEQTAVPSQSIKIPDALIGYSPANPQTTARTFHVKGCSIGSAEPWLVRLREALGDHVRVTAPKHYHGISTNTTSSDPPVVEVFEWMAYDMIVFRKTAFTSRDALAAAFHAKGYTGPNGALIPLSAFRDWLRTLGARRTFNRPVDKKIAPRLPLGMTIGGDRFVSGVMGYRVNTPRSLESVNQLFIIQPPSVIPTTDAGLMAALPTWLRSDVVFQDSHPFPLFKRFGYSALADMIDGMNWKFIVDSAASPPTVQCIGGRFEYELIIPIANPGTGGTLRPTRAPLIFNHIPETGAPAATPKIDEANSFFFATVP